MVFAEAYGRLSIHVHDQVGLRPVREYLRGDPGEMLAIGCEGREADTALRRVDKFAVHIEACGLRIGAARDLGDVLSVLAEEIGGGWEFHRGPLGESDRREALNLLAVDDQAADFVPTDRPDLIGVARAVRAESQCIIHWVDRRGQDRL